MRAQVAGDANVAGQVYPDQSLYPSNSVPALVERINNALQRADQIEHAEGNVQVCPSVSAEEGDDVWWTCYSWNIFDLALLPKQGMGITPRDWQCPELCFWFCIVCNSGWEST